MQFSAVVFILLFRLSDDIKYRDYSSDILDENRTAYHGFSSDKAAFLKRIKNNLNSSSTL
ncbi:MAG: hypothetical protein U9P44_00690 [archaeon]|nr:hypothetical protein [archaeon]